MVNRIDSGGPVNYPPASPSAKQDILTSLKKIQEILTEITEHPSSISPDTGEKIRENIQKIHRLEPHLNDNQKKILLEVGEIFEVQHYDPALKTTDSSFATLLAKYPAATLCMAQELASIYADLDKTS